MDIRKLDDTAAVTGQLRPKDIPEVKALGYRTVLCNRPDGEAEDQPLFEAVEAAARNSDLRAVCLPVPAQGPTETEIAALRSIWDNLPKPVLAYCRSGARSAALIQAALDLPAKS